MRWFHVEPTAIDPCPSYTPGLYTSQEIFDLVLIDGYIPVASAAEFNKISTGASETMGAGTCWAGTYTTGLNQKYIQVKNIDFVGATYTPQSTFTGIYDQNELVIFDAEITGTLNVALFRVGAGATYRNGRFLDIVLIDTSAAVNAASGIIFGAAIDVTIENCTFTNCSAEHTSATDGNKRIAICIGTIATTSSTTYINNCHAYNCSVTSAATSASFGSNAMGLIVGQALGIPKTDLIENCSTDSLCTVTGTMNCNGGFIGANNCTIRNCISNTTVTAIVTGINGAAVGGFVGYDTGGKYYNCKATGNVSGRFGTGGFCGFRNIAGSIFEECYSHGDATAGDTCGGFIGGHRQNGSILNCYAYGNASHVASINGVGGFVGEMRTGAPTITNCYSIGSATGGGSTAGGFCGKRTSGTITASYWDTDTSGNATSDGGTGQTTTQLQTPTSNTGIYSAWTIPPWDFGTSSEYPKLSTTP